MSVKGIIMFLGMNNTRLERKILIILDFENGFLPTYLLLCFEFFLLSLSIFGVAAWFPFDKGQSSVELASNKKYEK